MSRSKELDLAGSIMAVRWNAYRHGRHCAKRLKAFERDAAKAVKSWQWSASTRSGVVVVNLWLKLSINRQRYVDGFDVRDAPSCDISAALAACVERLTLEALQDVARATRRRLE